MPTGRPAKAARLSDEGYLLPLKRNLKDIFEHAELGLSASGDESPAAQCSRLERFGRRLRFVVTCVVPDSDGAAAKRSQSAEPPHDRIARCAASPQRSSKMRAP